MAPNEILSLENKNKNYEGKAVTKGVKLDPPGRGKDYQSLARMGLESQP